MTPLPTETVDRARRAEIYRTAVDLGARLKRVSVAECAGPCPVCAGTDRFSVNVKKQTWNCRGCSKGGGVIDLVQHVRGSDFRGAVAWLTGGELSNVAHVRHLPPPSPALPKPEPKDHAIIARLVADIVRDLVPLNGTPGEEYLAEIRRIDTSAIADLLERTDALGWHPSILFREEGHALNGRRLGCIVGIMTDPVTAAPTGAISRTWLTPNLAKVSKARTLGTPAGIIRLSEDADVLEGLFLAEGLETSVDAMARGLRPIWSTGSTALMAKFPLIGGVECLNLIADHDANGAGVHAATEAAERWRAAGRETHVYQREIEGDLNDAFREVGR